MLASGHEFWPSSALRRRLGTHTTAEKRASKCPGRAWALGKVFSALRAPNSPARNDQEVCSGAHLPATPTDHIVAYGPHGGLRIDGPHDGWESQRATGVPRSRSPLGATDAESFGGAFDFRLHTRKGSRQPDDGPPTRPVLFVPCVCRRRSSRASDAHHRPRDDGDVVARLTPRQVDRPASTKASCATAPPPDNRPSRARAGPISENLRSRIRPATAVYYAFWRPSGHIAAKSAI